MDDQNHTPDRKDRIYDYKASFHYAYSIVVADDKADTSLESFQNPPRIVYNF